MLKPFLLAFFLFLVAFLQAQEPATSLDKLNEVLGQKETYEQAKEQTINRLKKRLESNKNSDLEIKFEIHKELYNQYRSYIYDSAFAYSQKMLAIAYKLNDPQKIGYAKTQMGFITLSAGMFKETFDTLNTVRVSDLPDSSKLDYYSLMTRSFYDACDYNKDDYYCEAYVDLAEKYFNYAITLSDPNSYDFLYLNGLYNLREFKTDDAMRYLNRLYDDKESLNNHQAAIVASTLSFLNLKHGDTTAAVNLLADASILDIKAATKETVAMTQLAQLLYRTGQVEQAFVYINQAMEDANFYGAKQRKTEVASILPIIAYARMTSIDNQRRNLLGYSIGLTVLSLLTIVFALSTFLQFKKLRKKDQIIQNANDVLSETNTRLLEANKIKEGYMAYYFNINSEYLEKIEKFKLSVNQKLIQKKYEDIGYVMSRVDLKKEREDLYHSFDKVFLELFPDFIKTFNTYFKEEDQVKLEKDQLLNTELRIFALIRMGISDSDKLAKILGYSVNTIYAYKNRVKSKSILANDEFEKRIMEIEAI